MIETSSDQQERGWVKPVTGCWRRRSARTRRQICSAERMPRKFIHKFTFSLSTNTYQDCLLTAAVSEILGPRSAPVIRPPQVCLHAEVALRQTLYQPCLNLDQGRPPIH